uniref:Transmembrane protein 31 n=1 Tax=Neovison vison TaxID=452646 RepID=A0A8C7BEQ9_NEOVI
MGLTNKSEGELQLTSNNSDTSNSDTPREEQGKEIQQPEQHTPVVQRTRRAGTQPSRCRLPSHRTPVTSANRAINLLGALPLPIQWFTSPYQQPAILQLFSYPEFLLVFKEAFQDMSHCLKAHIKEIGIPIILHLSALSTLHFHLPFLPVLLSFFLLFVLLFLLLLLIILFILCFC